MMLRQFLRKWGRPPIPQIDSLPAASAPGYRVAEVYMFDTCTHRCGYCWLAESGQVLDFKQLEPFRSKEWIAKVGGFFNRRTTAKSKWLLQLTGGEPLIAPNLDLLCRYLFEGGNRVAFYTALLVGRNHPGFRFLASQSSPWVDYVMASCHPEAEIDEDRYFEKIHALRDAGHRIFLRYVGHPARLHRLDELAERCAKLNICFYPTTLLSSSYPGAYSEEERDRLRHHFSSLSQFLMLEGGIDTTATKCFAGSKVIGVNLQTGNITPCISVHHPSIGNVFRDELELNRVAISCPEAGINCSCDVHYQQDIVVGFPDRARFEEQKTGFVAPRDLFGEIVRMKQAGTVFYKDSKAGIGNVKNDSRLFYTIEEVRQNYRVNRGLPGPSQVTESFKT